jgi:hypothetical protein
MAARSTSRSSARDLAPTSVLPAAYFLFAHASLATGLLVLAVYPDLPAGVFYQPKVIALVHLVTIGWLTGSILGAIYIAGPLALGVAMPVGRPDWIAFGSFAIGAAGMVSHFWIGTYDGMAWSGLMVVLAVGIVGAAIGGRLGRAPVPGAVRLHLGLALFNFVAAAALGLLIGFDRSRGTLGVSSIAAVFAHAHIAAIGWVMLTIFGMAYRLIPMMLPAAMPAGPGLYFSAIFIEAGLAIVVAALLTGATWLIAGSVLIAAGIGVFAARVRAILRTRKPRPPALPRRDWSMWQTHAAMLYMLVAAGSGIALSTPGYGGWRQPVAWAYGVTGIVGFLSQTVAGIQGRLVPWYVWYRAQAARAGATPAVAANALPSVAYARTVFLCWAIGVPLLAAGLASNLETLIRSGALGLLAGVVAGVGHLRHMQRRVHASSGTSWAAASHDHES